MRACEHERFADDARAGRVLVGIDRPFARQVFTTVPLRVIKDETGERPLVARLVVLGSLLLSPASLLTAIGLSIWAFEWWSLLAIPLELLFFLLVAGSSAIGGARLFPLTLVAVASPMALQVLGVGWLIILAVSLALLAAWLHRFAYTFATTLLRIFVVRNVRAYNFFFEGITLRPLD